ncbi:hypothetical protein [Gulosibacter bifidus]|uniref:Uncharacterized protein n=1 Tax=Gulosibacter bifidus TaxID=272239 RepID=A0ABW5RIZ2_9MICO|nr:hypothetical protein [Gulosibacter bifidus]
MSDDKEALRAQRRALMKPFEVLGVAGGSGAFVFLIVLLTLKDFKLGLILAGITIVVVLLILGLLLLSYKPNPDVPVYLDRDLHDSDEPGARGAALRPYDGEVAVPDAEKLDNS